MNSSAWLPIGLVAINLYALALVLLRGPAFHTKIYRPMILNIGLSIAPSVVLAIIGLILVGIISIAPSLPGFTGGILIYIAIIFGGLAWFLLLPNAAYLVTELNLSHRRPEENVPLWYDIVLVLTLALSGVLNTLANVAVAQIVIAAITDQYHAFHGSLQPWIALSATLILVSLGMYLGRYLRLNSWDLLHPTSFARKMGTHFSTSSNRSAAVGFVAVHSILLLIMYVIVVLPTLTRIFE